MKKGNLLVLSLLVVFLALNAEAKIKLTSIWGDNMVLQQRSVVIFSGRAGAGRAVTLKAGWSEKAYRTMVRKDGSFQISLPTPSAGGPYRLRFFDGDELVLQNILIGEVWFCSGQSNMEMPVKGFRGQPVFGCLPSIVTANPRRQIRLYTVKRSWSTTEKTSGADSQWKELSSESVADFSAAGYFFGDLLEQSLQVPVGLINCSWSMSKIEAWMSGEALAPFKDEVQMPDVSQTSFDWPAGTPALLYNAMVNPWKGFPVRGVLWYQGEANTPNPALYKRLFPAMVKQWRQLFDAPELPFYYVQIAPWKSEGVDKLDWALFREVQLGLMKEVDHVGMVTTGDLGSEIFIHPPYKIEVGRRLAYWALAKTYGRKGFQYCGPIPQSAKLNGTVVQIRFSFGEDGLCPENQEVTGFEIAGKDGVFLPARAEIINGSAEVKVWNEKIDNPAEVRYCFRNYMTGDLKNNAGLPASPFRIDRFDK